jgi:AcrR family transcriptional regulator
MGEIHSAALRLALVHGIGKVTVEMIAAEAGVSRRTFFNYFPSKEAAVLSGPPEPPAELVEDFVAAGAAHPRQVLADLVRLLVVDLTADPPQQQHVRDMFEVAKSSPHLQAELTAGFDAFRRYLTGMVARRLGEDADDEMAGLIAGVAMATVFGALERWAQEAPAGGVPAPYLESAVTHLRTLLGLEGADSGAS